ncbi:hypothetical protein like AT1G67035 [Hibiscus trionum]|uniref:Uncharacterized protein n=1 Tax=Hibiscus trionum TaxID=183268 RepID=A0A9W7GVC6_HIBTR|nr:hypothetical protein like AT1G67035 [Hibiscus trionum]
MADTTDSLHQTHHSNPSFEQFFYFLNPISLILSQNHMMERGPKYSAYADLRENKLRMEFEKLQEWEEIEIKPSPMKKQVEISSNSENRQPAVMDRIEMTPPSTGKNWSNSRGCKSANSGEKKKGRSVMARKSYASVEELKAINGGSRGGRSSARLF